LATTTSILPQIVAATSHLLSNSLEFKAMLDRRPKETEQRAGRSMRAFIEAWYKDAERPVIFDKSRGWAVNALLLGSLFPEAKLLVMVRDLKSIFSSCEKQHRKTALFDEAQKPLGKTVMARYQGMFSPEGIIGAPLVGVMDLVRRDLPNVLFIQYESFAANPGRMMGKIYRHLELEGFDHDFLDVQSTAEDPDGLYLNKFPHKGSGEVKPGDTQEWMKFVPRDIVQDIARNATFFNDTFGYV